MRRAAVGPLAAGRIGLGAVRMGGAIAARDAHRLLDRFLDSGGTLVDTADTSLDGASEATLGTWLASRRRDVVVSTKVRFPVSDPGGEGLAADRVRRACDASLRRLGVDEIDLYSVNAPDPSVPLEETLEALDGLVRAGKVRALGCSNFPAYLLAWAVALQDREGWSPFVFLQAQYSLVERSLELELLPLCRAAGLAVVAWGPLGAGYLGGREPGRPPAPGSRMALAEDDWEEAPQRRDTARNRRIATEVAGVAKAHGVAPPAVALAWLLGVEGVAAAVAGPRTLDQLDGLLPGDRLALSPEDRARLERPGGPPEVYPQRMLREQAGIGDPPRLERRGTDRSPAHRRGPMTQVNRASTVTAARPPRPDHQEMKA
jgi:aryl-alcohol dehydrogenase-like predicted oxidoreductase